MVEEVVVVVAVVGMGVVVGASGWGDKYMTNTQGGGVGGGTNEYKSHEDKGTSLRSESPLDKRPNAQRVTNTQFHVTANFKSYKECLSHFSSKCLIWSFKKSIFPWNTSSSENVTCFQTSKFSFKVSFCLLTTNWIHDSTGRFFCWCVKVVKWKCAWNKWQMSKKQVTFPGEVSLVWRRNETFSLETRQTLVMRTVVSGELMQWWGCRACGC